MNLTEIVNDWNKMSRSGAVTFGFMLGAFAQVILGSIIVLSNPSANITLNVLIAVFSIGIAIIAKIDQLQNIRVSSD